MKRQLSQFVLMAEILLFVGCTTPGGGMLNTNTPQDAGKAPTGYEETIRTHLKETLKDPYSLVDLTIAEPLQTSCSVGIYGRFHAWRVAVRYNAKNSYGAYVGANTYYYWFHGETLKGISQDANMCPEAPGWK